MRRPLIIVFLGGVTALALSGWLPDNSHRDVARSETFASKLERAKRIDPETARTIANLISSLQNHRTDPNWESRRDAAIKRLEVMLQKSAATTGTVEVSAQRK
jgi:hypothetical protein